MTEEEVMRVWAQVTHSVMGDPSDGRPAVGAQLALAVPRGVGAGMLYLAVQHVHAQAAWLKLRPAIMSAIASIPDAEGIESFVVVVDPDAQPAIDPEPTDEVPSPKQSIAEGDAFTGAVVSESSRPVNEPLARHGAPEVLDSRLNPKYHFDTFVIGQSNRFAHAAAVAVGEAAGKGLQPSVHLR